MPENVHGIIKAHGRKYVENIISAVAECGFDLKALPVIIIGGGASIMRRYIRQEDSLCRPICIEGDRINAEGFERIAGQILASVAR